jgi:hypothetical protein
MSNLVYSLVLAFVLLITLITSVLITHLSARSYAGNLALVPTPDPNCLRFLPQFSFRMNMEDKVAPFIIII